MHNPIVTLFAIAVAVSTVLATDTPVTRSYWTKINGTWKYLPEEIWKSMAKVRPSGVPTVVLPLSQASGLNVTVLPRWVKGGRNEVRKNWWECDDVEEEKEGNEEGEKDDGDEENGDEKNGGDEEKGDEEEGDDEEKGNGEEEEKGDEKEEEN